jgi:hypothetical protein
VRPLPALPATVLLIAAAAASAQPLTCPPDTVAKDEVIAGARLQWCERTTGGEIRHGPFASWYPSGAREMRGEYLDGRPHGQWTAWHPDGAQAAEVTFVHGRPTGMLLGWYPSGQASFVGGFRDGTAIGSMETFDPQGRMRTSVDFGPDGVERSRRAWDEANREIDPRSPAARAAEQQAIESSPLINRALVGSNVRR